MRFFFCATIISTDTFFFFQAEDGIRDGTVTGVQTCALPILVTAWIYCLRGWLLSLMVNPRRRRNIIMFVTLAFILTTQAPQLLSLGWQRKARAERQARRAAQK